MNFIKKYLNKILFFLVLLILIILIGMSSVGRMANKNGGFFGNLISGFQRVSFNIGQTFTGSFYSVQEIVKMKEENILLTDTVYELQEQVRVLENIVSKSEALQLEYQMKSNLKLDYVIGQVIALDGSNWFSRFTIDKGTDDGIKENDIVIQAVETDDGMVQTGLVGIVAETGSNWSKVVTILDENCKLSFRDIDTDESGILQGSVDGIVTGYFFNSKAESKQGDSIVTSGIGQIYLPDLYIGKINEVIKTTDASSQRIVIDPAVDFTKLHKIFVLKVDR